MSSMFHVKRPARNQCGGELVRPWVAIAAVAGLAISVALLLPGTVNAAIYKCTGADGKATFGDQPCTSGHSVTVSKEPSKAPAANPKAAGSEKPVDASEAARAGARERLRAAQTPECVDMGDRIQRFGQAGGATQTGTDVSLLVERYERQCAQRMREAIAAENARAETEARRQNLAQACAAKRRVLDERRPRFASLSEPDQRAFGVVESEVARDCR